MPFLELNHLDEAICPLCDFEYVVTDNWPNDFSCRNCDYYSDVENHDKNAPFLPGEFECIECGRRASRFSANMFTIGRDPEEETCMDCAERQLATTAAIRSSIAVPWLTYIPYTLVPLST